MNGQTNKSIQTTKAGALPKKSDGVKNGEKKEKIRIIGSVDRIMLVTIIILICFGSIMVFSASFADAAQRHGDSYYYIRRQIIWVALSLVVMAIVSQIPYRWYKFWALPAYGFTLLLLLIVLVMGVIGGGAQRWIGIGGATFQPSELAKLTLVLMLAWYYTRFEAKAFDPKSKNGNFLWGILVPLSMIGLICGLVALEKHLSGVIIIGCIGVVVMFVAGCNAKWLAMFGGVGVVGVAGLALFTDYTKRRIDIWLNPAAHPRDGGWQTIQGMLAIGSGGLFGLGLGQSRQKYSYVSQPQNDFIFTIVCEELGYLGALAVLALFAILIWRGIVTALRAPDKFSMLVAVGITCKIALQVLLNVAVVTNTIPNTGISLPFFSYGGSSLLILFIEMGILLSVSREARRPRR